MKILVTGSASRLGRVLLPRLLREPGVEVTGVDRRPADFHHPRYREHRLDVRDPRLAPLVAEHDALVHLAFVVMRSQLGRRAYDRDLVRAISVDGSLQVLEAAGRAGLEAAVFLSSASVYGAWPDNPPRLTEDAPLRGIPGFAYAEDKVAVERALPGLAAAHPRTRFVSLRPHAILGRHAQPYLHRLLTAPVTARLPTPPRLQCVWEEDVAEAVWAALKRPVRGPFNLAAEPPLTLPELRRLAGRRGLALPLPWLAAAQRLAWRLTPRTEDPAWMAGARFDLVLDCTRARTELDWRPRAGPARCVRETVEGR